MNTNSTSKRMGNKKLITGVLLALAVLPAASALAVWVPPHVEVQIRRVCVCPGHFENVQVVVRYDACGNPVMGYDRQWVPPQYDDILVRVLVPGHNE